MAPGGSTAAEPSPGEVDDHALHVSQWVIAAADAPPPVVGPGECLLHHFLRLAAVVEEQPGQADQGFVVLAGTVRRAQHPGPGGPPPASSIDTGRRSDSTPVIMTVQTRGDGFG